MPKPTLSPQQAKELQDWQNAQMQAPDPPGPTIKLPDGPAPRVYGENAWAAEISSQLGRMFRVLTPTMPKKDTE